MGIPDHLTCHLRNLYAGQEATVRTGYGTMDWFKIGKKVHQGCKCHPAYLTYTQSTLCEMLDCMNHKLESRLPREILITSDNQMKPPLWHKIKIGLITSWQIDGETVETVAAFILRAPKSLQMVIAAMKLKDAYSLKGKL